MTDEEIIRLRDANYGDYDHWGEEWDALRTLADEALWRGQEIVRLRDEVADFTADTKALRADLATVNAQLRERIARLEAAAREVLEWFVGKRDHETDIPPEARMERLRGALEGKP